MPIKKLFQFLNHRIFIIIVLMLVQVVLLVTMVWRFNEYFVFFYGTSLLLSAVIVVRLLNGRDNPAYKLAWIIPILLLPVFGGLLYLLFGRVGLGGKNKGTDRDIKDKIQAALVNSTVLAEIERRSPTAANHSRYIVSSTGLPPFGSTRTEYLPLGEIKFKRMKQALEKAERYIFLEYFIIQEGIMWNGILDILVRKAAQGVDVRLIYDDVGCLFTLPYQYDKKLEALGIQCCVFNRFTPVLSSRFNYRSHRKICVIDGCVGFTGGINLADEYINAYEKYGHWKDTAILLEGDAVWGLTVMFLAMWDFVRGEERDYGYYQPSKQAMESPGFVQPYNDSPLEDEAVSENICLNMIYKAKRYVYITTPYLIVDNELMIALTTAAKCGVDVRIITPHIPDKWYVHAVTRANYQQLIEGGVRIYEYIPGFIHAKSFVIDDRFGTVGTVNLDFRSLYLHFECGVWLYETDSLLQMRDDFTETLKVCQAITLEQCLGVKWYIKIGRSLLRVFAPLM